MHKASRRRIEEFVSVPGSAMMIAMLIAFAGASHALPHASSPATVTGAIVAAR